MLCKLPPHDNNATVSVLQTAIKRHINALAIDRDALSLQTDFPPAFDLFMILFCSGEHGQCLGYYEVKYKKFECKCNTSL